MVKNKKLLTITKPKPYYCKHTRALGFGYFVRACPQIRLSGAFWGDFCRVFVVGVGL